MNTYVGGTQNKDQGDNKSKGTDTGEDLFLTGGFDAFGGTPEPMSTGLGQMNAGMGQLGSVGYGDVYGNGGHAGKADPWANQRINLNLWGQLFNSFLPFKYDRYKGLSIGAAKDFVKFFIKIYLIIGYLLALFAFFQFPDTKEYFKSGNITILLLVIILGVSYAANAFFCPYLFRLQAFIYRLIFGNLLMAIEGKKITSTNMYLVSVYACVPWMVIRLLFGIGLFVMIFFMSVVPQIPPLWLLPVLELIVPIVVMALAIPKME